MRTIKAIKVIRKKNDQGGVDVTVVVPALEMFGALAEHEKKKAERKAKQEDK